MGKSKIDPPNTHIHDRSFYLNAKYRDSTSVAKPSPVKDRILTILG